MLLEILILFLGAIISHYFYTTRKHGFFKSRGILEVPAHYPFGIYELWLMLTGTGD